MISNTNFRIAVICWVNPTAMRLRKCATIWASSTASSMNTRRADNEN